MPEPGNTRLRYIDWLRGLACLGMIEVHAYDAWLNSSGRASTFFRHSQFSGTLPAPLFMFLAGIAAALIVDRMRRKGAPANEIAARLIRRGAQIFGLGVLFRIQEFLLGLPKAPWTDLLRVDVLNLFGLSIAFMGVLCWVVRTRARSVILAAAVAMAISLATPLLWTTWRPRWLPWYLESYFNGVHIYGSPQPWLFPMFPWMAFAFTGLAAGFLLSSEWSTANPSRTMVLLGGAGVGLFALSEWFEALPVQIYPVHDYWHTSPDFFLARLGILLVVLLGGYSWCRWGPGRAGFSPLAQLGQTSLLVYWLHTEFVYGRFSILTRHVQTIPTATFGVVVVCALMLLLSLARTRLKGRGAEILARVGLLRSGLLRRAPRPATEG
jgi:uncharacterized membrane protein